MHSRSTPDMTSRDACESMPLVPCERTGRQLAREHGPESEKEIKSSRSIKSRGRRRRGRRRRGRIARIDCPNSSSSSPDAIRHVHILLNLFVLLLAAKTVLTHHHHQVDLLKSEHKPAPVDRWLGRIIIVPRAGASVLRGLGDIGEPILRGRRHQDEFDAPDSERDGAATSERDEEQQQVDGGNQFDSEHWSAAAANSLSTDDQIGPPTGTGRKSANATGTRGPSGGGGKKTEPTCDTLEDVEASRPPRVFGMILAVGYGIIFVLGLIGNVLTLYVLWCKGKKRTAQDVLVANLAISDVLLCVFCVPIMPKYLIIDGYWTLGLELCKGVSFAQSSSVYMSTYSLIYIGWIRYKLIVHPLASKKWVTEKGYALIACALTWATAFTLTVPYTSKVRLAPQECEIMFCDEDWEKKNLRFLFSLFTTVFQFIIPLAAVGFFNRKIYARLDERAGGGHTGHTGHAAAAAAHCGGRKSIVTTTSGGGSARAAGKTIGGAIEADAHTIAGDQHLYNYLHHHMHPPPALGSREPLPAGDVMAIKEHKQREKNRRMRKANNRLIFVVVVFAHSWLPLNLFNMIQDYFEELGHWKYLTTTFLVVHQIACSSVIWNPILYAWMSETYRSELRAALPKFLVAKLSSCLSDGPPTGGPAGHGGAHGPASTSVCTMHLNNNNNNNNNNSNSNTNGHHRRGSTHNFTPNNGHQTKSHMNLNQQPLQMHTELAKAKSIDHISEARDCYDERDEIQSLGQRSEIVLARAKCDALTGGRISPQAVSVSID